MLSCGVCVRPSVTFVSRVKANKDMFEIFSPSGIQAILVFPRQTEWRYSDGTPNGGGVECRWGRQKTRFWTNRCIQVYCVVNRTSRELWKKQSRDGRRRVEHSRRRPSSVVRARRRRSVCDGLDVIRRRVGQTPPDTTPLVITPVFCCRRTS